MRNEITKENMQLLTTGRRNGSGMTDLSAHAVPDNVNIGKLKLNADRSLTLSGWINENLSAYAVFRQVGAGSDNVNGNGISKANAVKSKDVDRLEELGLSGFTELDNVKTGNLGYQLKLNADWSLTLSGWIDENLSAHAVFRQVGTGSDNVYGNGISKANAVKSKDVDRLKELGLSGFAELDNVKTGNLGYQLKLNVDRSLTLSGWINENLSAHAVFQQVGTGSDNVNGNGISKANAVKSKDFDRLKELGLSGFAELDNVRKLDKFRTIDADRSGDAVRSEVVVDLSACGAFRIVGTSSDNIKS
jgi:alpha-D-ribose 1-methylphosphonate 5-triphosphate synthase subunit PhnI